jgi:hypothetical protein
VVLSEEQVAANLELVNELRAITEESERKAKQDAIASSPERDERPEEPIATPPSIQQDFYVWIREKWDIDFPSHPFPENMISIEDEETPEEIRLEEITPKKITPEKIGRNKKLSTIVFTPAFNWELSKERGGASFEKLTFTEKKLLLMADEERLWSMNRLDNNADFDTNTMIAGFDTKTFRILDKEDVNFDITNRG